jgi:hypothetical protein
MIRLWFTLSSQGKPNAEEVIIKSITRNSNHQKLWWEPILNHQKIAFENREVSQEPICKITRLMVGLKKDKSAGKGSRNAGRKRIVVSEKVKQARSKQVLSWGIPIISDTPCRNYTKTIQR